MNNKSALLLLLVPWIALAADATAQQLARDGATAAFWWVFLAIQVLTVVGHAASSLSEWAKWHDTSGTELDARTRRLRLLQGVFVSLLAGNLAYFGAVYQLALDQVQGLIATAFASWGGDKFLTPVFGRVVAVFQPQQKG